MTFVLKVFISTEGVITKQSLKNIACILYWKIFNCKSIDLCVHTKFLKLLPHETLQLKNRVRGYNNKIIFVLNCSPRISYFLNYYKV